MKEDKNEGKKNRRTKIRKDKERKIEGETKGRKKIEKKRKFDKTEGNCVIEMEVKEEGKKKESRKEIGRGNEGIEKIENKKRN